MNQVKEEQEQEKKLANDPTVDSAVEEFAFDMSMKKKKKKKKPTDEDEENGLGNQEGAGGLGQNVENIGTGIEAKHGEQQDFDGLIYDAAESKGWLGSDRDYSYRELLLRVFGILRQNNPDLAGEKRKFTIVPPQITREGSKKTGFANIADLSRRMRRPAEHVTQFLLTELGTTGSTDASQRLIIKGRFQQLQIENVLRRYIVEYVTCKTCHSPDTLLTKENRLYFLKCESCGSSRSVTTIKSGFKAQTGRRAAQRQ